MFTLVCPSCGHSHNVQVTAAMPLRAWLHCGSCNHLWKMSGVTLLCRWIVGGRRLRAANGPREIPVDLPADVPPPPTVDPAIEQWLSQGSDEARRQTDVSVLDWLASDPLDQPAPARQMSVDESYLLPLPQRPAAPAPSTLGERLDTFYDGLVRLEEFVKRCARQEELVAEAAAQAIAASAKASKTTAAKTAIVRRGAVLPFQRLAG